MTKLMSTVSVLSLVLLSPFLVSCGSTGAGGPPGQSGPPEVGVITVQAQDVPLTTELAGRTAPFAESEVRPQVNGIIKRRLFVEGGDVRAGQALYQIDPAPYRATLDQAKATVENARANAVTTQLKSARYDTLIGDNAISKQDADDARAAARQARATVSENLANQRSAAINVGYTTIRAPISGRIGRSSVTQGALVSSAQVDALTTIDTLDPIYVDVTQSASDLLKLRSALASGARTRGGDFNDVRLRLDDGSLYPLAGKLTVTESMVDQTTGTVTLRAVFPNPQKLLLPGLYVRAVIPQGVPQGAVTVPQQAVSRDPKGNATVMIVNAQGMAEQRVITATQPVGGKWIVTAGLKPGDRVIVEGLQKARPGVKLKVVAAGSRPAPPPGPPPSGQNPAPGK